MKPNSREIRSAIEKLLRLAEGDVELVSLIAKQCMNDNDTANLEERLRKEMRRRSSKFLSGAIGMLIRHTNDDPALLLLILEELVRTGAEPKALVAELKKRAEPDTSS